MYNRIKAGGSFKSIDNRQSTRVDIADTGSLCFSVTVHQSFT